MESNKSYANGGKEYRLSETASDVEVLQVLVEELTSRVQRLEEQEGTDESGGHQ